VDFLHPSRPGRVTAIKTTKVRRLQRNAIISLVNPR
jgi:hypothetical protein